MHNFFPLGAIAENFGRGGAGFVVLQNVNCGGSEQRLLDCESQISLPESNCNAAAGVTCSAGIHSNLEFCLK